MGCCRKVGIASVCLGVFLGFATLVACLVITLVSGRDTGGLPLPYVSDTGVHLPEYYVFVCGLCVGALCLLLASAVHAFKWRRLWQGEARWMHVLIIAGAVCGCVAAVCLACLAGFSTVAYPTPHLVTALGFFVLQLVHELLVTIVYVHMLRKDDFDFAAQRRSAVCKLVTFLLLALAFVLYIPVGLGVANFVETGAAPPANPYDYTSQLEIHLMRSTTQYLCVLFILLWTISLGFDISQQADDLFDVDYEMK